LFCCLGGLPSKLSRVWLGAWPRKISRLGRLAKIHVDVELRVDDEVVGKLRSHYGSTEEDANVSQTIVVSLARGQRVSAVLTCGYLGGHAGPYVHFTGHLLSPLWQGVR
jgi:hypothetical protein